MIHHGGPDLTRNWIFLPPMCEIWAQNKESKRCTNINITEYQVFSKYQYFWNIKSKHIELLSVTHSRGEVAHCRSLAISPRANHPQWPTSGWSERHSLAQPSSSLSLRVRAEHPQNVRWALGYRHYPYYIPGSDLRLRHGARRIMGFSVDFEKCVWKVWEISETFRRNWLKTTNFPREAYSFWDETILLVTTKRTKIRPNSRLPRYTESEQWYCMILHHFR